MSTFNRAALAVVLACATLIAACSNPVGDHEEHAEVFGLIFITEGVEIVRVQDAATSDTLYVAAGDTTSEILITFIDEHGDPVDEEHLSGAYTLEWIRAGDGFTLEDRGPWSFVLVGESAGTGSLRLNLLHGDENQHAEFTTPEIPVVVQ